MMRRSHLRLLTVVFQALTVLRSLASAARFGTTCSRTVYGLPDYGACQTVLFGGEGSGSGGISNIDSYEHGFLLPFFGHRTQFTDWQWRHRITLPRVWSNDLCRIALFVNSLPDGGFSTDSGWWSEVARRAKYVADTCLVDQYIGGGAAHAGASGKLTIIVFAPDSYFDRVLASGFEGCDFVAYNASRSLANENAEMTLVNLTQGTRRHGCQISLSSPSSVSLSYG